MNLIITYFLFLILFILACAILMFFLVNIFDVEDNNNENEDLKKVIENENNMFKIFGEMQKIKQRMFHRK